MTDRLFPWHKFQIWYQFSWLDREFSFMKAIASPTWFLTHSPKRIQRRINAYRREQFRIIEMRLLMIQDTLTQRKQADEEKVTDTPPSSHA